MKRSTERILTTHVGSLPRPIDLLDMLQAKEAGLPFDGQAHATRLRIKPFSFRPSAACRRNFFERFTLSACGTL